MQVKTEKNKMLQDYAERARAFKKDEARIKDEGVRKGYLKFLCPTPKDEAMFWAAYDALENEDENENVKQSGYVASLEKGAYQFSPENVGIYALNIAGDLAVLYYRALKEFLSLFKLQQKDAEKQQKRTLNENTAQKDAQFAENTSEKTKGKSKELKKAKSKNVERVNLAELSSQRQQMSSDFGKQKLTDDQRLAQYNESVRQRAMKKSEHAMVQTMGSAMTM